MAECKVVQLDSSQCDLKNDFFPSAASCSKPCAPEPARVRSCNPGAAASNHGATDPVSLQQPVRSDISASQKPISDNMGRNIDVNKFEAPVEDKTIKKNVFFTSTFSVNEAQNNRSEAQINVAESIFRERATIRGKETEDRMGDMRSCVISEIKVVGQSNTFPFPIAFNLRDRSGKYMVRGNYYNAKTGDRYCGVISNSSQQHSKTTIKVHCGAKVISNPFFKKYAGLTKDTILRGCFNVPGRDDVIYVKRGHMIITVLEQNQDKWKNFSLMKLYKRDIQSFELSKKLADRVARFILENIVNNLPYKNLGEMYMEFFRADIPYEGQCWNDRGGGMKKFEHNPDLMAYHMKVCHDIEVKCKFKYLITNI